MAEKEVKPRGYSLIRTEKGDRSIIETGKGRIVARNAKHARRLRMELAGERRLTTDAWRRMVREANGRCVYCQLVVRRLTMDHVVPLSRGGSHTEENVVPCCRECNNDKGDLTLEEWRRCG